MQKGIRYLYVCRAGLSFCSPTQVRNTYETQVFLTCFSVLLVLLYQVLKKKSKKNSYSKLVCSQKGFWWDQTLGFGLVAYQKLRKSYETQVFLTCFSVLLVLLYQVLKKKSKKNSYSKLVCSQKGFWWDQTLGFGLVAYQKLRKSYETQVFLTCFCVLYVVLYQVPTKNSKKNSYSKLVFTQKAFRYIYVGRSGLVSRSPTQRHETNQT